MKSNKVFCVFVFVFCTMTSLFAQEFPTNHFKNPEKIGSARYRTMAVKVYDGTLYAPNGKYDSKGPLAIQLTYLRSLHGEKIAKRSAGEIKKLGFSDKDKLASWQSSMESIFPDVDKGDSITGIRDSDGVTWFYNGKKELLGKVVDKEFGKWFFDIWLSEKTSAPEFRRELLGGK